MSRLYCNWVLSNIHSIFQFNFHSCSWRRGGETEEGGRSGVEHVACLQINTTTEVGQREWVSRRRPPLAVAPPRKAIFSASGLHFNDPTVPLNAAAPLLSDFPRLLRTAVARRSRSSRSPERHTDTAGGDRSGAAPLQQTTQPSTTQTSAMPDLHGGGNLDKYEQGFFFVPANSGVLGVAVAMTSSSNKPRD